MVAINQGIVSTRLHPSAVSRPPGWAARAASRASMSTWRPSTSALSSDERFPGQNRTAACRAQIVRNPRTGGHSGFVEVNHFPCTQATVLVGAPVI